MQSTTLDSGLRFGEESPSPGLRSLKNTKDYVDLAAPVLLKQSTLTVLIDNR